MMSPFADSTLKLFSLVIFRLESSQRGIQLTDHCLLAHDLKVTRKRPKAGRKRNEKHNQKNKAHFDRDVVDSYRPQGDTTKLFTFERVDWLVNANL